MDEEEKAPIDPETPDPPEGEDPECNCGCTASDEDVDNMLDEVFGSEEEPDSPPDEPPPEDLPPPPSILQDVKKWIGITREYEVFDSDILMSINAAFFTLHQLGVGPREGFAIEDGTEDWPEFSDDKMTISAVKQYVQLKVRNTFDPPTSSYVLNANQTKIDELEWRLREQWSGRLDYEEETPEDPEPIEPPPEESDPSPDECTCCCPTASDEEVESLLDEIFNKDEE